MILTEVITTVSVIQDYINIDKKKKKKRGKKSECPYSLSVNNFPEFMRVSEVCMLLIVVSTLLTK